MIEAEIIEETKEIVLSEIKYQVSTTDLKALLEEYKDIPEINPDADEDLVANQFAFVIKGHKAFIKARTGIEKTRKHLKQPALDYGKTVDGMAKEFQALIKSTEDKLLIQRKIVEDNEARKQHEAEEAEENRIEAIRAKMKAYERLPLEYINSSSSEILAMLTDSINPSVEEFEEFWNEAVSIYTNAHSQLREMHDGKVLVENAKKIQDEAEEKAKEVENERLRLQQEEQNKLNAEREEFEVEKAKFAEQQRLQQEDLDRKEAERKADELQAKQEAERINRDKAEREKTQNQYNDTCEDLEKLGVENSTEIATAIFDGFIRNVKWSPDAN